MLRLPQTLADPRSASVELGLGEVQLVWLLLGLAIATTLGIVVRSDNWLRRYKYTWAAVGIALLLLVFAFGVDIGGSKLTLRLGPISGQPSELLKVILVVFLAGYLSENRPLLIEQDTRIGPLRLPPLPYLAPMVAMWAIALGVVVVQRDLGAALLFFGVFLALLYAATGRVSLVVIGLVLFFAGSAVMATVFDHVRTRVDIWLDPFADPLGAGYQIIQALHAFARGGSIGMGLGNGLPLVDGRIPIPKVHTDFPLAALGEELGLVGVVALLGAVPRHRPARAAHRGGRGGRLPGDPRDRSRAGHRLPGLHHRGRQPQGPAADRRHAAVHQLRRLVDGRELGRRRPPAGALRQGRRAAAAADGTDRRRASARSRRPPREPARCSPPAIAAGRWAARSSTSRSCSRSPSASWPAPAATGR